MIRKNGVIGKCSFCCDAAEKSVRHRKIHRLENLMGRIMPTINSYFMSSDGNIPFDREEQEYIGNTIALYDFVHEVLGPEMKVVDLKLLDEIISLLQIQDRTSVLKFYERQDERDLAAWNGLSHLSIAEMICMWSR